MGRLLPLIYTAIYAQRNGNVFERSNSLNEISVQFNLRRAGASVLLSTFLDQQSWDGVLSHGCWCSKLDPDNRGSTTVAGINIGGCDTVEDFVGF